MKHPSLGKAVAAVALVAWLNGCTGGAAATDGGTDVVVASDVSADVSTDIGGDTMPAGCVSDDECSDGLFCNGVERCSTGAPGANARGCVSAAAGPCTDAQTCDEAGDRCADGCPDADRDGHRSGACGGDDCDDADPMRYPGRAEVCDAAGHDEDCDPCTIAGASGDGDSDSDTFVGLRCTNRFSGTAPTTCDPQNTRVDAARMVVAGADCDDADRNVRPNQTEACNGRDDNCNGMIDEGATRTVYPDADGDGYGARGSVARMVMGCALPAGFAETNTDCDDGNRMVNPAATELCDGIDNNCDGVSDNGGIGGTFYRDSDGDGRGDPAVTMTRPDCVAPAGWAARTGDCNDRDATVYVGAADLCDGVDNSCSLSGTMAGGPDPREDRDGDRHAPLAAACAGGPFPKDDCNETDATIFGGATEICDGLDNNCSLLGVLAGGPDPGEDGDGDGHSTPTAMCTGGPFPKNDCNDADRSVFSGATEVCDGRDNDCSLLGSMVGGADPGEDRDGDHHAPATAVCLGGPFLKDDCNDADATVYPGAPDICDGRDNDCDGVADELPVANRSCSAGWSCFRGHCVDPDMVVQVAAGPGQSCVRRSSGAVLCWGENTSGELGDGTTTGHSLPVRVPDVADAVEVRIGGTNFNSGVHACIRRPSGAVLCWGGNSSGQLGDGTTINRLVPTAVVGLSDATEVSVGYYRTCARRASGAVVCWGNNGNGELGDGTTTNRLTPRAVMGLTDAVELSAGGTHTCARRASGAVVCWGSNRDGQLGDGTTIGSLVPTAVEGLTDAAEISAGQAHVCARRVSGAVVCWGYNFGGQLGDGTTTNRFIPTAVVGLSDVLGVSSGSGHACARRASGAVVCWGSNRYGQVGDGTTSDRLIPTAVLGLTDAIEVSVGQSHSCVLRASGEVNCWGDSRVGQLGIGVSTVRAIPAPVLGLSDSVRRVIAGAFHNCVVRGDTGVSCWGYNFFGQLGDGTTTNRLVPAAVVGLTDTVDLSAGDYHTCARRTSGALVCWGSNEYGRLGDGTTTNRPVPTAVVGLTDSVGVSAGGSHTCVLRVSGAVVCWGHNYWGQLGDGTTINRLVPTAVVGLSDAVEVSAGYYHTCARRASGAVVCWGNNPGGQLGDGTTTNRLIPTAIAGLTDAIELSAGGSHTCARRASGAVVCWGNNAGGQLGDGTTTSSLVPTPVAGLGDAAEISAGQNHVCARRESGAVVCWGYNYSGQLGDGTTTNRFIPTAVVGLTDALGVSSGHLHACARRASGAVVCWGFDQHGELGDNEPLIRTVPVAVMFP